MLERSSAANSHLQPGFPFPSPPFFETRPQQVAQRIEILEWSRQPSLRGFLPAARMRGRNVSGRFLGRFPGISSEDP